MTAQPLLLNLAVGGAVVVGAVGVMLLLGWVVIRSLSVWSLAMDDVSVDDEVQDLEEAPHGV